MEEAFEGADIVYPKSWAPYHVMQRRTALLQEGRQGRASSSWRRSAWPTTPSTRTGSATRAKMNTDRRAARPSTCTACPPTSPTSAARPGEVSAEVFEQYRIATYHEASYKPFVIARSCSSRRMQDPGAKLESIVNRAQSLYL